MTYKLSYISISIYLGLFYGSLYDDKGHLELYHVSVTTVINLMLNISQENFEGNEIWSQKE